ncbi:MAG: hypothetical protein RLZZ04_4015 [Cyanobacteriota bacterium]
MNIKITALAFMLAIGFPLAAQAQNTNGFDNNVQTPSPSGVNVQTPSQSGVNVQTPSESGFGVQTPSETPSEPEVNLQEQDNELVVTWDFLFPSMETIVMTILGSGLAAYSATKSTKTLAPS